MSWVAPVGSGLRFDVGKFVTLLGYEVIDGYDGYNDNNSRSFLFEFAIPFTHTGVKATYVFSPKVSFQFGVGEYFADKDGVRLGLGDTNVMEGTISPYFKPSDHLVFRLEGRLDHASNPVFVKSDGTTTDLQPTLGFNAMAIY